MPDVKITGLTKRFGDVVAVDAMNLHVPEGSLTTFLGPSGCGKTTTLRMIAGLETPTEGEIAIGNEVVYRGGASIAPERRNIGMVFQSYAIWPHMTVFNNVAYPLQVRRRPRKEIRERTMQALATVRMTDLAERYPAQLSGGQQQRVAVARAIVFQPRILLFDEPLSNLDAKLREAMRIELRELQQRLGVTTLYVTHDQQEALAISDQVAVMDQGKIVQLDRPQSIYESPANKFVADFVGWTNFLRGTISDGTTVDIEGSAIRCRDTADLSRGAKAEVTVRPVDFRIGDEKRPGDNEIAGELRTSIYMGKYLICEVAIGANLVQAYADLNSNLKIGQRVMVRFQPDAVRVLKI
ncbi:MAG: ABC transporter ATP-binding protein [Alphaproteobacteria bacterium]|nr:ABC transporter ATP-binding protein [Alphaproteobacteria bacterium]